MFIFAIFFNFFKERMQDPIIEKSWKSVLQNGAKISHIGAKFSHSEKF